MRTLQRSLRKKTRARGIRCPRLPPLPWNMITVGRVAANYNGG